MASAEYESLRIDPTTDRDRWDDFDDGGLEAPGEDEWDEGYAPPPTPGYHDQGGEKGRRFASLGSNAHYAARERRRLLSAGTIPPERVHQTPNDKLWTLHPADVPGTPEYAETVFDPSGAGHDVSLPRSVK